MSEVGLADGDRVKIIADGTFGTAVHVMPLTVDVERDNGTLIRLRHAQPDAQVKTFGLSGKNWGPRCAPRGITNTGGTCTVVAIYQLLVKTGLYRYINAELKHSIDTLLKSGTFDLEKRTCPKLPHAKSEDYKALSGGSSVNDADGIAIEWFVKVILRNSPELAKKVTSDWVTFSTQSMWRSQRIFDAIIT